MNWNSSPNMYAKQSTILAFHGRRFDGRVPYGRDALNGLDQQLPQGLPVLRIVVAGDDNILDHLAVETHDVADAAHVGHAARLAVSMRASDGVDSQAGDLAEDLAADVNAARPQPRRSRCSRPTVGR